MARNMIIVAKCDSCGVTGDESMFAMDIAISVPRLDRKPKAIDLCTEEVPDGKNCLSDFSAEIGHWLGLAHTDDTGALGEQPAVRRSRTSSSATRSRSNKGPVCQVPRCDVGVNNGPFVARSTQGLIMHLFRGHGFTKEERDDYFHQYGTATLGEPTS